MQSNHTIQEIFQTYGPEYIRKHHLSKEQWKAYNSIIHCKTKELGIHNFTCKHCGEILTDFNSCRNRHCPMCQGYKKEQWIQKENKNLLNCPYFHIVTTVPHELNEIFFYNKKICYNILFKATSESILTLGNDDNWLGAKIGITSLLHTWGQTMEFHPHIHSIVTGGGLKDNKWIDCKEKYLFKVQVLTSLFKGKFLGLLKEAHPNLVFERNLKHLKNWKEFNDFLRPLYNKDWVTYIEPPKGSPENVIEYIGRYAFRVAISNQRIKDISNNIITFEYKDYKDNNKIKIMKLSAEEFIRRFLLHILPDKFTKIKHYGLFCNNKKTSYLVICRNLIQRIRSKKIFQKKDRKLFELICPSCGSKDFFFQFFYKRSYC